MASLTADLDVFSSMFEVQPIPMRCDAADTFFRGGLVFFVGGQVTPLVADTASEFAGVVAEHTVTTAADQFVQIYRSGIFLFANTAFTIALQGALFYQTVAGEDDPGTLTDTELGSSGAVGRLIQVRTTAVDGWIDISDRSDPANS
jgi:hypothetical protein